MNFGRNFAKFDDFGHVRNFLTNEIQNSASNFLYPSLVPTYYFPLAYIYFPLHIHWPHNSHHFFFWKELNSHHYLWKEKKDVYYLEEK